MSASRPRSFQRHLHLGRYPQSKASKRASALSLCPNAVVGWRAGGRWLLNFQQPSPSALSPLLLSLKRASLPLLVSSLYSARDRVSSSTVLIPSHNSPTSRYPQHGLPFKKSGKCDVAGSKSPSSSSPGLASSPPPPSSHVPCVRVLLARARPRTRARASSPRAAVEDEEEGEDEEEAKAELVLAFVTRSLAHGRRAVAPSLPLSIPPFPARGLGGPRALE